MTTHLQIQSVSYAIEMIKKSPCEVYQTQNSITSEE